MRRPVPQRHRRGAVEPSHTRSFVDDDATLEDDPPESAREPRRLHGGAVSHEGARAKCGRSAPRLDLSGAQLVELLRRTHLAREGDHLVACTLICFNSDRVHVAAAPVPGVDAAAPVPGVDAVALAELSDRIDAGCDRPACFDRAFHAVKRHEAMELVPPPLANPPLRPLGPPPQMSCSRMAMPRSGLRSCRKYAVHRPVNPPPTMTTSALMSLLRGGHSAPGSCASASRSHQLRWLPGVRASPVRWRRSVPVRMALVWRREVGRVHHRPAAPAEGPDRSEEHTSELQS